MNHTIHVPKIALELQEILGRGEEIVVEAGMHFSLDSFDTLWWVEGEGGDLYFTEAQDPKFIPIFLLELVSGEILLGSPSLFLACPRKTTLRKHSFSSLQKEVLHTQEAAHSFTLLLERFVRRLLLLLPQSSEIPPSHFFKPEEEVRAEKGHILALERSLFPEDREKIAWIELQEGSFEYPPIPESITKEKNPLFPLIFSCMIEAKTPLIFRSTLTEKLLGKPQLVASLEAFYKFVFFACIYKKEKKLADSLVRMQKMRTEEEEQFQETFYKLGSVLNDKLAITITEEGSQLFKAVNIIGEILNTPLFPALGKNLNHDMEVREIASNSGIFFRRISLGSPQWWKRGSDPILGFFGEEKTPVALLPQRRGLKKRAYYCIVDPIHLEKIPLTESNASLISEEGYVFFEGFPKKLLRFRDFCKTAFKRNLKDVYGLVFLAFCTGLVNLFTPFAMKQLFDAMTFGRDFSLLGQFSIGLLLTAFASSLFSLTKNFAILRIEGLSKIQVVSSLWTRILMLPASFFRKVSSGNLMGSAMLFEGIRSQISQNTIRLLSDIVYCFFYLALMFYYSPAFTALGILGMFLASVIYATCITAQVKLLKRSVELTNVIQGLVVQIISGIPKIRVAGAESRFFGKWGDLFSQKKRTDMKIQYATGIQSLIFRLFPMLMTGALFSLALIMFRKTSHLNLTGSGELPMTLGTFIGFNTAYSLFISSTLEIFETAYSISAIVPKWKKAKFIGEEELEARPQKVQKVTLKGEVVLDRVFFRYSKEGAWTLQDINFVANPGEMVAIVGPSGCGKSSIVRLLLGFETPEEGEVLYDDADLRDLDMRQVRRQIGVVLQNAGILSGSLYDNIVGAGTYTAEEIERALKLSAFDKDLEKLPMGLNTVLPMGGSSFSGGQRQRLYLARALVSSPKILILDEATSALDNKTQEFVASNLDKIEVTRIVIAHRLSSIMYADRIYVMDQGKIEEVGTFQELAEKGGLFAEMLKRQKL